MLASATRRDEDEGNRQAARAQYPVVSLCALRASSRSISDRHLTSPDPILGYMSIGVARIEIQSTRMTTVLAL